MEHLLWKDKDASKYKVELDGKQVWWVFEADVEGGWVDVAELSPAGRPLFDGGKPRIRRRYGRVHIVRIIDD